MNLPIHPSSLDDATLIAECEIRRTRGSGPGGQHRNKVETAIVMVHRNTGVSGQASERRSQHENRRVALSRLRINLAIQVRTEMGPDQKSSETWCSRLVGSKMPIRGQHSDFPALLAEALDFVASEEFDVASAAKRLGVSTSQLIKFLKVESPAFQLVNQERMQRKLHPLK